MCGIAGWLGRVADPQDVASRLERGLHHRGPDARASRLFPVAALVHTRLSIIDLSPTGAQPMSNEDGTVWVSFNGEIYNHHQLRTGLEARGHQFRGRSDTEILPHLYEEYGTECFARLRGMFAIAIYDTRRQTMVLARDRFGIKPLFYATADRSLAFASELLALRAVPAVDDRPDLQAISDFAALFYVPAPQTFFRGIRALCPGELLEAAWSPNGVHHRTRSFHRWSVTPDASLNRESATDRARELLLTAVGRQIESDVPLGSLLSGGIDSSLVSAAAKKMNGGIKTYNVRFPDPEYDETWAALEVARHIDSDHETLDMSSVPGTWNHVVALLRHAGQPFADTSLFATHAVCALMRRHVTVALSGDGGDEVFGGYDFFWQIARIARLQRAPLALSAVALFGPWIAKLGLVAHHVPDRAAELNGADDTTVVQGLLSGMSEQAQTRLCIHRELPVRRLFEPQAPGSWPGRRLERLSAHLTEALFRMTLPNDFLFKVDIASMREGLEIRVPLLDEDVVELGLTLPHALKEERGIGKQVLRAVAAETLPQAVAAKRKAGFAIPVDTWVADDFRHELAEALLRRSNPLRDVFRAEIYEPWVAAFCQHRLVDGPGRHGLYRRVIMLLALHLHLETRPLEPPAAAPPPVAVSTVS